MDFHPAGKAQQNLDPDHMAKLLGEGHRPSGRPSRHPGMHRTKSIDYIIVLKGEIHAVMEKGETLLRAGDILVQRGTNHSWSVRGGEPCIVAAVLVDAKPLVSKKKTPSRKTKKKK